MSQPLSPEQETGGVIDRRHVIDQMLVDEVIDLAKVMVEMESWKTEKGIPPRIYAFWHLDRDKRTQEVLRSLLYHMVLDMCKKGQVLHDRISMLLVSGDHGDMDFVLMCKALTRGKGLEDIELVRLCMRFGEKNMFLLQNAKTPLQMLYDVCKSDKVQLQLVTVSKDHISNSYDVQTSQILQYQLQPRNKDVLVLNYDTLPARFKASECMYDVQSL